MDKAEILSKLRKVSDEIDSAQTRAAALRVERDNLIRKARRSGLRFKPIAEAANITVQRVEQVVYDPD